MCVLACLQGSKCVCVRACQCAVRAWAHAHIREGGCQPECTGLRGTGKPVEPAGLGPQIAHSATRREGGIDFIECVLEIYDFTGREGNKVTTHDVNTTKIHS